MQSSSDQKANMESVTTIIPTTAEKAREELLRRAIASAATQEGVESEVIVVVNGCRFDPLLLDSLKSDSQLTIVYREVGNVSLARHYGTTFVNSSYFGFLDDDDEYLPKALSTRVAVMKQSVDTDVVVTNGYIHEVEDKPLVSETLRCFINDDPMLSFLNTNWFASPASLFKRESIPNEVFDIQLKFFEWSYLFFKLHVLRKNVVFDGVLTYRKYEDNPLSVSKTADYAMAYLGFLKDLYTLPLPSKVRKRIKRKQQTALNELSAFHLDKNEPGKSINYHLRCLLNGGWRYLPYTRKVMTELIISATKG